MARALLIAAATVDVLLAALLVAISGFVFGPGPESMHGGPWVAAGWTAMVAGCLIAPVIGFVMRAYRRPAGGILVAWLPPAGALILSALPAPY